MLTRIAVDLKNIHQRITEIMSFHLNHDFPQFPNLNKMKQATCECDKMKINIQSSFGILVVN